VLKHEAKIGFIPTLCSLLCSGTLWVGPSRSSTDRGGGTIEALRRVPHPKFGLVRQLRHAAEHDSPVFATPFPCILVYIVIYDVIFWSGNLRNIRTDKVNVGIFWRDAVFLPRDAKYPRY